MKDIPNYKSIILEIKENLATITINKPDTGNSICGKVIEELYDAFNSIRAEESIRNVLISSSGSIFCLGPEMTWLKESLAQSRKESLEESILIGKLMFMIYTFPKPVICKVTGNAAGCGVGLMSVCDIVITEEETELVFDEVKYGFTPSLYAPYVIKKIGESKARELFLTGRKFKAPEAKEIGLVNYLAEKNKLDSVVSSVLDELKSSGPQSVSMIKDVLSHVRIMRYDEVLKYTSECVADMRESEELKEGVNSRIEKRNPSWL